MEGQRVSLESASLTIDEVLEYFKSLKEGEFLNSLVKESGKLFNFIIALYSVHIVSFVITGESIPLFYVTAFFVSMIFTYLSAKNEALLSLVDNYREKADRSKYIVAFISGVKSINESSKSLALGQFVYSTFILAVGVGIAYCIYYFSGEGVEVLASFVQYVANNNSAFSSWMFNTLDVVVITFMLFYAVKVQTRMRLLEGILRKSYK